MLWNLVTIVITRLVLVRLHLALLEWSNILSLQNNQLNLTKNNHTCTFNIQFDSELYNTFHFKLMSPLNDITLSFIMNL